MPVEDLKKTIGQNIKKHRAFKGWNQQTLANKVNLKKETISRIESGIENTTIDNLVKIFMALELQPEEACLENANLISFRFLLSEHNIGTLNQMLKLIADIIANKSE